MQDSSSFWTDIKNLEEQLAKAPDSFCFARLSDVYLKVGLIEDALHVARQGVIKHPGYLSGQKALSLACLAKGLNDEALKALKLVTEAFPEDIQSQKLLGRLYAETGNKDAACQAFRTALEFAPDDVECQIELESIEQLTGVEFSPEPDEDDEAVIDDLEILEELDILEDDQLEPEFLTRGGQPEPEITAVSYQDPLSTGTLAELYVTQGFIHKALEIYRAILIENPSDRVIAERLVELESLEVAQSEPDSEMDYTSEEETESEPTPVTSAETFLYETEPVENSESVVLPALESQQACSDVSAYGSDVSALPPQGVADNALSILDGWLENIGRIKSCR